MLNQGRKVFEGRIADVKAVRGRVKLKTPDFVRATAVLYERGINASAMDANHIELNEGRTIAEATKALVSAEVPVDGIWQHEQTLEDFYLELVKGSSNNH